MSATKLTARSVTEAAAAAAAAAGPPTRVSRPAGQAGPRRAFDHHYEAAAPISGRRARPQLHLGPLGLAGEGSIRRPCDSSGGANPLRGAPEPPLGRASANERAGFKPVSGQQTGNICPPPRPPIGRSRWPAPPEGLSAAHPIECAGRAELNYKRSTSGARREPLLMAEPETISGSHLLAIIFVRGGSARGRRRARRRSTWGRNRTPCSNAVQSSERLAGGPSQVKWAEHMRARVPGQSDRRPVINSEERADLATRKRGRRQYRAHAGRRSLAVAGNCFEVPICRLLNGLRACRVGPALGAIVAAAMQTQSGR